jgi:hypothetical protein
MDEFSAYYKSRIEASEAISGESSIPQGKDLKHQSLAHPAASRGECARCWTSNPLMAIFKMSTWKIDWSFARIQISNEWTGFERPPAVMAQAEVRPILAAMDGCAVRLRCRR